MNKITQIEIQKRNNERVNIYVDGEYTFACNAEFVFTENLKVGMAINLEQIKDIVANDEIKKCKNTALKIIEKSFKTEKEVHKKLIEKGYDESIVLLAIEFLKEYKYLDDERYANMYIRDRVKFQGQNKIKYDLRSKGIADDIIKKAFSENIDKDDEKEVAINLAKKKYDVLRKRESDKYKLSQKLYRFLLTKGYNYDIVSEVVRIVTNEELEEDYYES
ncbi:MAG: recombination regulator RecX [Sarcina sp.]